MKLLLELVGETTGDYGFTRGNALIPDLPAPYQKPAATHTWYKDGTASYQPSLRSLHMRLMEVASTTPPSEAHYYFEALPIGIRWLLYSPPGTVGATYRLDAYDGTNWQYTPVHTGFASPDTYDAQTYPNTFASFYRLVITAGRVGEFQAYNQLDLDNYLVDLGRGETSYSVNLFEGFPLGTDAGVARTLRSLSFQFELLIPRSDPALRLFTMLANGFHHLNRRMYLTETIANTEYAFPCRISNLRLEGSGTLVRVIFDALFTTPHGFSLQRYRTDGYQDPAASNRYIADLDEPLEIAIPCELRWRINNDPPYSTVAIQAGIRNTSRLVMLDNLARGVWSWSEDGRLYRIPTTGTPEIQTGAGRIINISGIPLLAAGSNMAFVQDTTYPPNITLGGFALFYRKAVPVARLA
jgi:hypothetical protein